MTLEPVFENLTNSPYKYFGVENFYPSKKALMITAALDANSDNYIACGFLFHGVRKFEQIPRNESNSGIIGCTSSSMSYRLYRSKLPDGLCRYVAHTEADFIVIEAQDVELVEGLEYAGAAMP